MYLTGMSDVTNSGTIAGGVDGVIDVAAGGSVENSGVITGTSFGLKLAADAQLVNTGSRAGPRRDFGCDAKFYRRSEG